MSLVCVSPYICMFLSAIEKMLAGTTKELCDVFVNLVTKLSTRTTNVFAAKQGHVLRLRLRLNALSQLPRLMTAETWSP